ncbi:MAG: hypothetical protein WCR42_00340 [bacterium]
MKSRIFITFLSAVILFSCVSYQADAQTKVKRVKYNNTLSANPIALMFGNFPITYEKALKGNNTVTCNFTYTGYDGWSGFNLGGSYRWYVLTTNKYKPNEGLSAGPTILFGYWGADSKLSNGNKSGFLVTLGAEAAYKMVIDKGFSIEPIVQINFPLKSKSVAPNIQNYKAFTLGVNLGYSW